MKRTHLLPTIVLFLLSCTGKNNSSDATQQDADGYTHLKEMNLTGPVKKLTIIQCDRYTEQDGKKQCIDTADYKTEYFFNTYGNLDSVLHWNSREVYYYKGNENTGKTWYSLSASKYTNKSTYFKRMWRSDHRYRELAYNLERHPDTAQPFIEFDNSLDPEFRLSTSTYTRDNYLVDVNHCTYAGNEYKEQKVDSESGETTSTCVYHTEERDEVGNPIKVLRVRQEGNNLPDEVLLIYQYEYYK